MSTVEEIVEAIKELAPKERDEVRRQLVSLCSPDSRERVADVKKADHPYRVSTKSPSLPIKRGRPRRPPIKIKGKPVSETVVEDRR